MHEQFEHRTQEYETKQKELEAKLLEHLQRIEKERCDAQNSRLQQERSFDEAVASHKAEVASITKQLEEAQMQRQAEAAAAIAEAAHRYALESG